MRRPKSASRCANNAARRGSKMKEAVIENKRVCWFSMTAISLLRNSFCMVWGSVFPEDREQKLAVQKCDPGEQEDKCEGKNGDPRF